MSETTITSGPSCVTDAGLETDLIFHHGVDLPQFAAFPLLESEAGRALLRTYYAAFADIAARHDARLLLESPTWRANPDWGAKLGYAAADLARINTEAMAFLRAQATAYDLIGEVVLVGTIGPRGDGYRSDGAVDPVVAQRHHAAQVEALAGGGADVVTAYTLIEVGEAIGIVRAARAADVPVAIGFTLEVDGRLPGGLDLREAIARVDDAAAPDYYLINCAHPAHILAGLEQGDAAWRERVHGVRVNASELSHAELDESEENDEGDPDALARGVTEVLAAFSGLRILGGCCGTDARHVAAMWDRARGAAQPG